MGKAGLSVAPSTGSFILFVLRGVSFAIAHFTPRYHLSPVITGFYNENALAGVVKNSRSSLRRMRCAYYEDCAGAQNEELALLVE